jgi:hypothetical protein
MYEWREGSSKNPKRMSLDPALAMTNGGGSNGGKKMKLKTVASVSKELKEAKERIEILEQLLKENDISFE